MVVSAAEPSASAAVAGKAAYASSLATFVAGVTLSEWVALCGLAIALATFAANLYYRARDDRRAQREHEARMVALPFQRDLEQNRE
jgi:hypothetical protein